jgi:hypothetical protein
LTEIYLWHACSYHEVEDGNARPGGVLLYAVVIGIALHGETTAHFIGALACIGLGWNFIYTSGSALLVKVSAAAVTGEGQGQWRQGQWQWWQWCCVCPPCMLHTPHAGCARRARLRSHTRVRAAGQSVVAPAERSKAQAIAETTCALMIRCARYLLATAPQSCCNNGVNVGESQPARPSVSLWGAMRCAGNLGHTELELSTACARACRTQIGNLSASLASGVVINNIGW